MKTNRIAQAAFWLVISSLAGLLFGANVALYRFGESTARLEADPVPCYHERTKTALVGPCTARVRPCKDCLLTHKLGACQ